MGSGLGGREKEREILFRAFLCLPLPYFRLPRRLYFVLHLVMTSGKRKDTTKFIEENPIWKRQEYSRYSSKSEGDQYRSC